MKVKENYATVHGSVRKKKKTINEVEDVQLDTFSPEGQLYGIQDCRRRLGFVLDYWSSE